VTLQIREQTRVDDGGKHYQKKRDKNRKVSSPGYNEVNGLRELQDYKEANDEQNEKQVKREEIE
jgi:hypothetical protein